MQFENSSTRSQALSGLLPLLLTATNVVFISHKAIQNDSKLLWRVPWPINGNPDNNVESPYILYMS
jgi:hypothetical protein